MGTPHGTQGSAKKESPSTAGFKYRKNGLDDDLGKAVAIRIGKILRCVQQRLACIVERAVPIRRIGFSQPHFSAVMSKILLHRKRRRSKDPGTWVAAHLLLHYFRDDQRRRVELQGVGVGFAPANVVGVGSTLPAMQLCSQLTGTAPAVFQSFGALCLRFKQGSKRFDLA